MEPFLGQIIMFGGNFAPRGWALCDGQTLSIAQNSALFSILGTIYGGDGRTNFKLPDLRGRSPMHEGTGPGLPTVSLGQSLGAASTTLDVNNLPSHNHTIVGDVNVDVQINCNGGQGTAAVPTGNFPAADTSGFTNDYSTTANGTMNAGIATATSTNTLSTLNLGIATPFENRHPVQVVSFIIALLGTFPSRN